MSTSYRILFVLSSPQYKLLFCFHRKHFVLVKICIYYYFFFYIFKMHMAYKMFLCTRPKMSDFNVGFTPMWLQYAFWVHIQRALLCVDSTWNWMEYNTCRSLNVHGFTEKLTTMCNAYLSTSLPESILVFTLKYI